MMRSKTLLLATLLVSTALFLSCSALGLKVKTWYLDGEKLIRKQTGESVAVKDAKGFFCLAPQDLEALLNSCSAARSSQR